MFEDEEKFWEEMNLNKEKRKMDKKEKTEVEEKINKEQKIEVKKQKAGVKKQCTSFYNKYKRKREDDEDTGEYNIYKKRSIPGYFQYTCELLANDEKTLYEIFKEYPSIFTRHYKSLKRILYERDRLKKRLQPELTWLFCGTEEG
jgi:hypothetical protein